MVDHLEQVIQKRFDFEKELKSSERSKISLVRDKETRKRHICLQFQGSGEVYRKMQGINCPYLPKIEEVIEQDGQTTVLEEYIQGDTLAYLLDEQPLAEELVRPIAIQICHALNALHSIGVVHRDIKPENIILRGDEAVLIDFDASRVSKPERVTDTQVMGTTGYAAPEQYGFAQTDARADIYAFGVLLNEMLTRQHPARSLAQGSLTPIIEKCIEVNMDKRYASAAELLTALEKPIPTTKPKRRKLWLLLPAFLLAIILAGFFLQLKQADDQSPTDSLQQVRLSWNGDPDIYGTTFHYDLDEDGENEEYVFAAMFNFVDEPRLLQNSRTTINDKPEVLEVVGAVWKQTGEKTYEPVDAFAPLLSSSAVTVRKIEGEHEGVVEEIGALYGIWPGAIRATFEYVGLWYYECSAVLAGETLTAVGSTQTELLNETTAPEKDTPTTSGDTFAQTSVDLWTGEAKAHTTPFRYDLDGDGVTEEYLFGVAINVGKDGLRVSEERVSLPASKGHINNRTAIPVVWRQTDGGDYEAVEEFAPLLEDATITLWCVEGETQPEVWDEGYLLGIWPNAIRVTYKTEGTWLYECTLMLAGQSLTATSITATQFT